MDKYIFRLAKLILFSDKDGIPAISLLTEREFFIDAKIFSPKENHLN